MTRLIPAVCGLVMAALAACSGSDGTAPAGPPAIDDRPGAFTWKAIGAGTYNSCAIGSNGQRYCWGQALVDACGATSCVAYAQPVPVGGAAPSFDTVASGGGTHCGLTAAGEAYCWGDTRSSGIGSLGDSVTAASVVPVRVQAPGVITQLTLGYSHACVLTAGGDAYCWGDALGGKLGRVVSNWQSVTPALVSTTLKWIQISAGTTQTCGVAADSTAWCWGGGYGTLGVGALDTACGGVPSCTSTTVPLRVSGGLRFVSLSAGNAYTCGVTVSHAGYCWGAVNSGFAPGVGVLGNGSVSGSLVPVPVAGGVQFSHIVSGTRQACGLTLTGEAWCWGDNARGELGIGQRFNAFTTPQKVRGGLTFRSLSLADGSCGISAGRNLYCWGLTYGGSIFTSDGAFTYPTRIPGG